MRSVVSASLRNFSRDTRTKHRIYLKDLDSHFMAFEVLKKDARALSAKYLSQELFLAKLTSATVCYLVLAALQNVDQSKIISCDFPANDLQLAAQLTRIANTSICVFQLARDGYDTQARILLRTLSESIYQTLILFSDADDYLKYKSATTTDATKEIWYELFGGKKRLFSKLATLESQLGLPREDAESLRSWRESKMNYYSEAIHHGVFSATWGSFATGFEDDRVYPAILGHAGPEAGETLDHLYIQMSYFCRMIYNILRKTHSWVPDMGDEQVVKYMAMERVLKDVHLELIARNSK